jgi:hypothetical protein
MLDILKGDSRTVTVKDFKYTARDGATLKHVVLNWGDGSEILTNNTVDQKHQYAADGTYTIRATPYFTVNGATVAAEGANCVKTVGYTTPVTPVVTPPAETPTELPAAGAGSVAAVFALTAAVATVMHRLLLGRKLASS